MDEDLWLQTFAEAAGCRPLGEDDRQAVLALAGVAAHASARTAAPLSCWLAAGAGLTPQAALALAERLAGDLHPPAGTDDAGPQG